MRNFFKKNKSNKILFILAIILLLTISISGKTILTNLINRNPSLASNNIMDDTSTPGVTRTADESTMNSYQKELLNDTNGSRFAGRIWTDKSVFATGEDSTFDGGKWTNNILYFGNNSNDNEWQVETSDDFLNVFSTVTSSQQIIQQHRAPLDIVLVLDMSGSMGDSVGSNKSRIEQAADAINTTLEEISEMDGARVGLQIYSSIGSYYGTQYAGFQTVLPLDSYTKSNNSNYLTVSKKWNGDYTVRFRAQPTSGKAIDKSISSTGGTTTQMGIYEGMKMLAEATNVKETINGETLHRTPVMILITDGVPTYVANNDWWNPTITQESQQLGDGSNNKDGLNFATMLTAAYMKKVVNLHYYDNEKGSNGRSARIYTISVDTDNKNKDIMESTFNPKDKWGSNSTMSNSLKNYWDTYESNKNDFTVTVCSSTTCRNNKTLTIKHPTSTDNKISDLTEEDMKYNNNYYDVKSANLQEIFGNIMDSLSGEIFNPIEGTNSAGVSNSLTFAEPLGLYMEIKDKAIAVNNPVEGSEDVKDNRGIYDMALLLYNEMHGIVKTAVYDESFIEKHKEGNEFKEGWYSSNGNYINQTDGKWENGDTYYVKKETALQFVPTIPEKSSSSSDDEDLKHIVYTLYRIAEKQEVRQTPRSNPCYGDNSEVTFNLSDIRIWVEESDNYVNQSGMTIPGSGYDSMLYINLPAAAIPSEVAKITLDNEGNITKYETNIDKKGISNPLRVFYSVGIKDKYLTEDGLDMDLTKVSQEYIEHFKNDDGSLNFYDSYWSESSYTGYKKEQGRTRGDTTLSFSPSQNNKYYFFQKNLTLYTNAYYIGTDGSITKVDSSKYETKPLAKIYEGKSENNDLPEKTKEEIKKDLESKAITNDTIVILSQDVITDTNSFTNDGKYYIVDEYYAPDDNGKGKKVEIVIQRSGQDFSLGTEGESEKKGDYLCWKNSKGEKTDVYDFDKKPTEGEYVLSTKVGALRVGNLSSNIGTKEKNKTETAYNYYIPTISVTKDNNDVDITNYLGNNGRLIAQDTLLMITKELEGTIESDEDDKFNFEVYIEGKEGDFQGIVVKKHENETGVHWDYIIEKVEVVVDDEGYLLAPDDTRAVIEKNGQKYIMKLSNGTEYQDKMSVEATLETKDISDGIQKFYVNVDYYSENESNSGVVKETNQKVYVWETATGNTENGNENKVGNQFKTKSSYQTVPIKFGYKKETSKEIEYPTGWTDEDKNLTPYTANITLKPDEGIIINGIKSGADYKVTEVISKSQDLDGVNFKKVVHKMNNSTSNYDYESSNSDAIPGNGTNGFKKEESNEDKKTYMVFGDTGNNMEEIHFTNYDKLKHLTITKDLEPETGTTITEYDKNTKFKFNISFKDLDGNPLKATISYVILEKDKTYDENTLTTLIKELKLEGTENETFTFELKANEKIVFDKLPLNTGYKYELLEEATEGYKSQNPQINGVVEANSDGVMPQTVENIKLLPKVDVDLNGTKTLIGDTLTANAFEFTISPKSTNSADDPIKETTVKNDENGNIPLINAEYHHQGTYEYTIKEKNTNIEGVIYDSKEYNVKVVISEDSDGKLQKEITITNTTETVNTINFTNIYVNKPITITGTKTLVNGTLTDNQFKFTITPDSSNPKNDIISSKTTVTNQADGTIEFLNGTYKNLGTYKYHVREEIPEVRGTIIYDTTEYDITVTIKLTSDNTITSDIEITSNDTTKQAITFRNININEKVELKGYKHLTGGELSNNQFSFTITPDTNNPTDDPITAHDISNDAEGNIPLINATYTKIGTYKYHINEKINSTTKDIEYDTTTYDVVVDIKLNNGDITHKVTILNNDQTVPKIEFTNYIVDEKVILNGTKYLENGSLKDQEFSFIITPDQSNPENDVIKNPTIVKNDAKGNINFLNAEYTHKGTYKYQIKEVIPEDQKNIIYDKTVYDVTIIINIINGKISKQLDIKVNGETRKTISFNNILQVIDFKLEGTKNLIGRDLKDQEFNFIITPDSSNPESDIITKETTVKNSSTGNIELLNGTYKELGTYKYHIKEDIPTTTNNILYDQTEYDVIVTLSTKDNQINKEVIITNNNQPTDYISFTNIVRDIKVQVNGLKKLIGGKLKDSEFKFLIIPDKNNPENDPIKEEITTVNDLDGKIPIINSNYITPGIYKYQIYEIKEENNRIINYDQSIYEITVTIFEEESGLLTSKIDISKNNEVTDDIIFTNSVVDPTPNTYDNIINYIILLISTIFTSLLVLFINQRLKRD